MGSQYPDVVCPEDALRELDRVLEASVLRGSETLRKLLRYLVQRHFERPDEPIRESQIARELLAKGDNWDSRIDPTVRVQVGRLRSKLVEYYATEGVEDDVWIEIPRGSYDVSFRSRVLPEIEEAAPHPRDPAVAPPEVRAPLAVAPEGQVRGRRYYLFALALLGTLLVIAAGLSWIWWPRPAPAPRATVVDAFWKVFVDSPGAPLVVFSNGVFVGNPVTGMRYFNPASDQGAPLMDHYTGVGEVMAIHELDRVFFVLNRSLVLKRSRLLNWDDAKNRGVIFVGSPSENLKVKDVAYEGDFSFRRSETTPHVLNLVNVRPLPGERPYFAAVGESPVTEDYALISLMPEIGETHPILWLAGTTTMGTQAAVEFVCHESTLTQLMSRMPQGRLQPFSAVIHTRVTEGVPVSSELAAFHLTGSPKP